MRQALLLAAAGNALGLAPRAYAEAVLRVASIAKRRSARMVVTPRLVPALVATHERESIIKSPRLPQASIELSSKSEGVKEEDRKYHDASFKLTYSDSKFGLRN